ncbi:c-type cytochrome [Salinicoccus albus]|uniref:c-type cytochrome n=1 Tax=Salinicoccus albus TaxID=418756 RepID=UPI000365B0A8|nr:cytochrome c [Salinicoccus albus]
MANDNDNKHLTDKEFYMEGQNKEEKVYIHGQNRNMIERKENDKKNPLAWIIPIIVVVLLVPLVIHLATGNGGHPIAGDIEGGSSGEESSGASDGEGSGGEESTEESGGDGGGEQASSGDFDAEGFARDNCASCHGEDFSGGTGPALAGTSLSEEDFSSTVREGPASMPAFSQDQIADEDLTALHEYLAGQ